MDNTASNTYTSNFTSNVYHDTQNVSAVPVFDKNDKRSGKLGLIERILWRVNPHQAVKATTYHFMRPRRSPYKWSTLPQGAEQISVIHNLRKLVGYAWGQQNAPTVLLVHDWDQNLSSMMAVVTPLVQAGYRVVAFDAPGHGQSPEQQTHMIEYSEAIRAAMEQFEVKRLIAHGIGATASMVMLANEPEIRSQLKQIVLLAPTSSLKEQIELFARRRGLRYRQIKQLRKSIESHLPLPIRMCDAVYTAGMMSLPGLIFHDESDQAAHFTAGLRIASSWYNAIFEVTSGLAHDALLSDEDIIDSIIDFFVPHRQLTTETSEAPVVF